MILPTDKGDGTCVVSREDYVKEGNRQLSDPSTYKILNHDIINKVKKSVEELLVGMKKDNVIDQNLYSSLLPTSPVPGRLYFLPKVHKQGNPGRPIISSNGTATEKLSAFVDFHLTRYMSCNYIPSYIKDIIDFFNAIFKISKLSNDILLVTRNVKALYTNIPHKEGIAAVQTTLNRNNVNTRLT